MTSPLDDKLRKYHLQFGKDHDQLRSELIASLPDQSPEVVRKGGGPAGAPFAKKARVLRIVLRPAIVAAAAATIFLVVIFWTGTESVTASEVFADVLRQIRAAGTVKYTSTLEFPDGDSRTSEIMLMEPGLGRKTQPDGIIEISDYSTGKLLHIDPCCSWAMLTEYVVTTERKPQRSGVLEQLKNLANDAGSFTGREELGGQLVNVFSARSGGQEMTIWTDPQTDLPVKVRVVKIPSKTGDPESMEATVTLSDFQWNVDLDESLLEIEIPEGFREYHIRMPDQSLPPEEKGFVEALRILTDVSDGFFPKSLHPDHLAPAVKKLRGPQAVEFHLKTGANLVAGVTDPNTWPDSEPVPVALMRASQRRRQVSRGLDFVKQLNARRRPWRYVGAGVKRGQKKWIFWYQPEGSRAFRVILGDLSVREVPASKPTTEPSQAPSHN